MVSSGSKPKSSSNLLPRSIRDLDALTSSSFFLLSPSHEHPAKIGIDPTLGTVTVHTAGTFRTLAAIAPAIANGS